jgi:hypothetical protein
VAIRYGVKDMATAPTTQAMPQNPPPPQTTRGSVELASKFTAALLFSVYASGFLITSLHTSVYGFTAINPLRPKILAAGAWFLFFAAVPVMLGSGARKQVFALLERREWFHLGEWVLFYYGLCVILGLSSIPLFDYPLSAPFEKPATWSLVLFLAATLVVLAAVVIIAGIVKGPRIQLGAMALYVAVILYGSGFTAYRISQGQFDFSHVTLWLFGLGVWTLVELRIYRTNPQRWVGTVFVALLVMSAFARYYCPRIKSSWGGGSPISVVLYLSKDAPVAAGKQLQAILLDESDAGYYVVPAHENKAIFFPRDAVSLVFFAEKTSDSTLLRTEKP